MTTLVYLALLCLGLTVSARSRLPVLYLREPGTDLELDPRALREAPAFYFDDPSRYQREVLDDHGEEEEDIQLEDRPKRKTPLSFLFFEKDGRSQGKAADLDPKEADASGSEDRQLSYNGYPLADQETTCSDSACKSKCLASSRKQNGGRCQNGRCVCAKSKSKIRRRMYKKTRKQVEKIPV